MTTIDYLAIGHVTEDVWKDGRITPGGTAWFSSLAARRLVDHVSVLTAAAASYDAVRFLPEIEVERIDSPATTQFENIYTPQGRTQYTRPSPVKLTPAHLTGEMKRAKIMHLAPVCDEVSSNFASEANDSVFIGVTPQGWLRRWDETGRVFAKPWDSANEILARADAVVISIDDVAGDWRLALTWAAQARLFVVTQNKKGCILFLNGEPIHVDTVKVDEVDPTGAGDIFAATLFITLQQGIDPVKACTYANCIAAQSVTRQSIAGLPTPEDLARCGTIL
jgi:sugar/nucleoside kinase (ribokinase family)